MGKENSASFRPKPIYTLAQNGTDNEIKPAIILRGKGSEICAGNFGKRKGTKKIITQCMALHLIDIAKEKGRDVKPFWNTYYCMNGLISHNGRIYGTYCKNRFCTNCTGIRKAEKINTYYPVLKDWTRPYFVTLTVKSCKHDRLRIMMQKCIVGIQRIVGKYKKRNYRGKGIKLVGIRSLECNFNPVKKIYNPHFHIVVQTEEMAKILVTEWLNLWTRKFTYHEGQDYRPIWDLENALIETIKYASKIFTEPKSNEKGESKTSLMIYAKAYFNIIEAMEGLRLFERFGFNLPKEQKEKIPAFITTDYQEWIYLPEYHDWQNTENELTLTGFTPEQSMLNLLKWNVDTTQE